MKKTMALIVLFFTTLSVAQVYQNFPNPVRMGERGRPDVSAILDVSSVSGGILGPRMTEAERDLIPTPAEALFIFNTTANEYQVYNGVTWQPMGASALNTLNDVNVTSPQEDEVLTYQTGQWTNTDTISLASVTSDTLAATGRFSVTTTDEASLPCPVMTEAQRDLLTPVSGDCVYNSDLATLNLYDGTEWVLVGGGGGLDKWLTGEEYEIDDVIWDPASENIYVANTAHTAGATFIGDIANWDELSSSADKLDKFTTETNDNRLVRTDGDGNAVQGSLAVLDDAGALSGLTQLDVDNISIDGNTISSTNTNGDVVLDANGTGIIDVNAPINLESVTANQVAFSDGISGNIVGDADFTYDSLINSLSVSDLNFLDSIISSTVTNRDITLSPDGTGEVDVTSPANIENVRVAGNAISVIDTDGNLSITANGTGEVSIDAPTVNLNKVSIDEATATIFANEADTALQLSGNGTGTIQLNSITEVENFILDGDEIQAAATNSDINFVPNGTGDLKVTYGTNELSLDPSRHTGSLLRNPDFENEIVEFACTDATGALVPATLDIPNNNGMFQMTVTGAGGYCDFIYATDSRFVGLPFVVGALVQTELTDVDICALVNGVETACSDVTAVADIATGAYHKPLAIEKNAGGTSVGFRVKTTTSSSGVVNVDKLRLDIDSLPTGPAASCSGDLDCENTLSAFYDSSAGATSGAIPSEQFAGWLTGVVAKSETNNRRKAIAVTAGVFTVTPKCWTNSEVNFGQSEYDLAESSTTSLIFRTVNTDGSSSTDDSFTFWCEKQDSDFKTIQQQGVVNVGRLAGDTDWQSYIPVFTNFGTVTGIEFFWRKQGDSVQISGKFVSGTPTAGETRVSLPDGLTTDTAKIPSLKHFGTVTRNSVLAGGFYVLANGTQDYFTFGRSDSSTSALTSVSGTGTAALTVNGTNVSVFAEIPIEGWSDNRVVNLTMQGVTKIEGEDGKDFVEGWASFGGASDGTVCSSGACNRYREIGNVGRSMTATRVGAGDYDVVVTGFQPNSSASCTGVSADDGTGEPRDIWTSRGGSLADGSGNVSFTVFTTTNSAQANTYFQIYCKGQKAL